MAAVTLCVTEVIRCVTEASYTSCTTCSASTRVVGVETLECITA